MSIHVKAFLAFSFSESQDGIQTMYVFKKAITLQRRLHPF